MMRLFSEGVRNDTTKQGRTELLFPFLDRSADPEIVLVRNRIESWFSGYPDAEKPELRARMVHRDGDQFHDAFFELTLHRLLISAGCELTPHPDVVEADGKRPDFLVREPGGRQYLLEATFASGMDKKTKGAQKRHDELLDQIDRIESDFYFHVSTDGYPPEGFAPRRVRNWLEKELRSIDADKLPVLGMGAEPVKLRYPNGTWRLRIEVYPKYKEDDGSSGSLIGWCTGARFTDSISHIRTAVEKKATRYGDPPLPLVVAVQDAAHGGVKWGATQALIGRQQIVWNIDTTTGQTVGDPYEERKPDGAWVRPSDVVFQPVNTRLSAVLYVTSLTVWDPERAISCLFKNPWAKRPYEGLLEQMPQCICDPKSGRVDYPDGRQLGGWLS